MGINFVNLRGIKAIRVKGLGQRGEVEVDFGRAEIGEGHGDVPLGEAAKDRIEVGDGADAGRGQLDCQGLGGPGRR